MNYPIWELVKIGGGTLIALISILHVYISHLAVGGGLFIWLTDRKGFAESDKDIHAYVKKHTWFFLLLTMVFGGVTGVGIWFIIALVSPAATSTLIHNFVFGWAIEWVFFLGEITALLLYYYRFDKLDKKGRITLSFLYFLFAWLSLVIINGILSFMLTPGAWLETAGFWDGFFNPTYFPSLVFRTAMTIMIAGIFGYVTIVFRKESEFRTRMIKYCSKWIIYPVTALILFAVWYYFAIPGDIRETAFALNPQTIPFTNIFIIATVVILIGAVLLMLKMGKGVQKAAVFVVLIIGLFWIGGFEYLREIARKPFVINEYMYSTSILKKDMEKLNTEGVLKNAKWSAVKDINSSNIAEAGRELFNIQCLSCHTIDGIRNDILPRTNTYTFMGVKSLIAGQGRVRKYMPPFIGAPEEMDALAVFISGKLNGKEIIPEPEPIKITPVSEDVPEFDKRKDDYVLLAWNDLGMHCISDSDPWFVILPPANTLEAQLIKRGSVPAIVTEGVKIRYKVEKGFENPSKHVDFWKWAKTLLGADLEENVGIAGNGLSGEMKFNEERNSFIVEAIPVAPYTDEGTYNPYPLFTVEAVDEESGEVLMSTKVVAPTSTEMGCRNCHGGPWKKDGISGLSDETAVNILQAHDRLSGTDLYQQALDGKPMMCQACHSDPAVKSEGDGVRRSLSASIHSWHANYAFSNNGDACVLCHPSTKEGNTRCNRGVHSRLGFDCTSCHGKFSDHAIALLKGEANKAGTDHLLSTLVPVQAETVEEVNPRTPWLQEPDCLGCHEDFEKPGDDPVAFNKWTEGPEELYRIRTGNAEVRCEACHNSPHVIYPAVNHYSQNRDNLQPLQYSGKTVPIGADMTCETCHKQKMEDNLHHENIVRMFRNRDLLK